MCFLKVLFTFTFLILFNCVLTKNTDPVIGVLAQQVESDDPYADEGYTSYIASSYVKAVEASGARVVPVFIDKDDYYYEEMAKKVNGFLITGGASDIMSLKGVARSAKIVFDSVKKMKRDRVNVPILGVCLGFEILVTLSNDWRPILAHCNAEKVALSLNFTAAFKNSSLYSDASKDDIDTLSKLPSTSNHHVHCLTQANLTHFNLTQWSVLSTSKTQDNFTFVSSMEWTGLPIAAVQFHPEKLAFEWKPREGNPHDDKSIKASRLFYDWLVAQSRLNNNSFQNSSDLQDNLIYNYCPIYTGRRDRYDTQDYYFTSSANNYPYNLSMFLLLLSTAWFSC